MRNTFAVPRRKGLAMATEAELVRELQDLLHLDPENPTRLTSRENSRLEYKERFNWASRAKYGKTLAAFGNNAGGFIVFGVQDSRKCRFGRRVRYVGGGHNALHPPAAERLLRQGKPWGGG